MLEYGQNNVDKPRLFFQGGRHEKISKFFSRKGQKTKNFCHHFCGYICFDCPCHRPCFKKLRGRRTDLAQTTAAATAPTDTSKYWTDEAAWSAAGKDFNNYTLSGSGGQDDPYLIQNEWDLAYLSWTIYTNNPIDASHVSSYHYYYSGIYFEQTADLDLSAYYWQPIGITQLRDGSGCKSIFLRLLRRRQPHSVRGLHACRRR